MEKILYGDLGSERLVFGKIDKNMQSVISGIYNSIGGTGYGYLPLSENTGLWYYVDKYGARGGGYLSAYIGPITDSPIETLSSLKFATVEDFKNARTEWSGKSLNEGIQTYEEKNKELIDSMDDKEIKEVLTGCINASDKNEHCDIIDDKPAFTIEEEQQRQAVLLKKTIGNLPKSMQQTTSFCIYDGKPGQGEKSVNAQIKVISLDEKEVDKWDKEHYYPGRSNCYYLGSTSKNKSSFSTSEYEKEYMNEYFEYLIDCARRNSRATSSS